MRPIFQTFLCLLPFTLAAGALYLLAITDLARIDQEPLTEPWRTALDQAVEEEIWGAARRHEAKRLVVCALIDGRLTLQQAATHFRNIDIDRPNKAWDPRPPKCTEEEWAWRQVISYVDAELAIKRRVPALAEEWACRLEAELGEHLPPQRPVGSEAPR